MLTRIAPIFALPYCSSTHSAQFGAQIPTRSPVATPEAMSPRATASVAASSCAYVQRLPVGTSTSASLSPCAAAIRRRLSPIVSPSSGSGLAPWL